MQSARNQNILITGPTFITNRHLQILEDSGITPTRLNSLTATEAELIKAVQGMDGYILGGLERVTQPVLESAQNLRAICFTGAGWTEFVPAHEYATQRGIAITAAPGANAQAVAELTVALIHDRVRHVSYLSGQGFGERIRARNFRDLTLGVIGVGNVGSKVARILNGAYGTTVLYAARRRNLDLEFATGAKHTSLDELLGSSDIVSLHMRRTPETIGLMDRSRLNLLPDGAILVNAAFADAVDPTALFEEVNSSRISAALDVAFHHLNGGSLPDFQEVSQRYLLQMGVQSGFNTERTVELASDLATKAMINLLVNGNDVSVVNPQFVKYRSATS